MSTVLDIANRALSAIGARSGSAGSVSALQSLNEKSNEAFQVNLLFVPTQNDLLRSAHWNFARKTAVLSLLKAAPGTPENASGAAQWSSALPAPPWLYEYAYPADCLKMRSICRQVNYAGGGVGYPVGYGAPVSPAAGQRFIVAADQDTNGNSIRCVLTNAEQAIGVYTAELDNPATWDSSFEQTMVSALAARLCIALTGDKSLKQELLQEAQMYVQSARVNDGNEGSTTIDRVPDWIAARGYGLAGVSSAGFMVGWDQIAWLGI
jgi:hypothetical protein